MAIIINFPTKKTDSLDEFRELLRNITLPDYVDKDKWEEIAVPNIHKLFDLPAYNHTFHVTVVSDSQAEDLKNELSQSIRKYGEAVRDPLVLEVAKLYMEICKIT